jgi:hypothetical protein
MSCAVRAPLMEGRRLLGVLTFAAVLVVASSVFLDDAAAAQSAPGQVAPSGTLYERARASGGRAEVVSRDKQLDPHDLHDLVQRSDLIVIGKVRSNKSRMTADGSSIETHYVVDVTTVVKGDSVKSGSITVAVPGGHWRYSDGTSVSVLAQGVRPPLQGDKNIWLLSRRPGGDGTAAIFSPVGTVFGIYAVVPGTDRVRPIGALDASWAKAILLGDFSSAQFVSEIRAAVTAAAR